MIDIVIPAWTLNDQVQRMTENAIGSVEGKRLIIVDNASPQGGGYLRSKATTYVRNNENLGFAKAVNQGIKLATSRYVAILSTDVRVSPNWEEVALKTFDPTTFSVHFRMTDYDIPFGYGTNSWSSGKERWCTAAFFVLDKEKGLLFDERFFNSFEDWDLFHRARLRAFKTIYTNKASYQHAHSFTQKFIGFKGTDENKELFKKIHGEYPDDLLFRKYPEQVQEDYLKGFEI